MSATRCGTTASTISERTLSLTTRLPRNAVRTATSGGVADGEAPTAAATVEAVYRGVDERRTAAPSPAAALLLLGAAGGGESRQRAVLRPRRHRRGTDKVTGSVCIRWSQRQVGLRFSENALCQCGILGVPGPGW